MELFLSWNLKTIHTDKRVNTSRKPEDMICTICGGRVIGFKYDIISRAACNVSFVVLLSSIDFRDVFRKDFAV